jgi:hypothetical protein
MIEYIQGWYNVAVYMVICLSSHCWVENIQIVEEHCTNLGCTRSSVMILLPAPEPRFPSIWTHPNPQASGHVRSPPLQAALAWSGGLRTCPLAWGFGCVQMEGKRGSGAGSRISAALLCTSLSMTHFCTMPFTLISAHSTLATCTGSACLGIWVRPDGRETGFWSWEQNHKMQGIGGLYGIDDTLLYNAFHADFGPLHIGHLYRFAVLFHEILGQMRWPGLNHDHIACNKAGCIGATPGISLAIEDYSQQRPPGSLL